MRQPVIDWSMIAVLSFSSLSSFDHYLIPLRSEFPRPLCLSDYFLLFFFFLFCLSFPSLFLFLSLFFSQDLGFSYNCFCPFFFVIVFFLTFVFSFHCFSFCPSLSLLFSLSFVSFFAFFIYCHEGNEHYNCMYEARRKASSGKALLLFLVTCMHDAMQAVCMLCAVWRTRDTVICGTEWFLMHDWTFWKVCERTRNSETLPDLELLI